MSRETEPSTRLCSWDPSLDIRPKCGFRIELTTGAKVLLAGIQEGNTERYEKAWGLDTTGGWIGAPPFMEFPRDVRILGVGSSHGGPAGDDGIGADTVYRVPSGVDFHVSWDRMVEVGDFKDLILDLDDGTDCYWFIRDCATGGIIKSGNSPSLPMQVDALADGSYALFCQVQAPAQEPQLPRDYVPDPAYYYYESDIEYYYDPVLNIGRFPLNAAEPLRIKRQELIDDNKTQDRNEWINYLVSPFPQTGDWSGIKFVVGSGEWGAAPGVQVAPGVALAWVDANTPTDISPATPVPIHFDDMARQVTLPLRTRDGRCFIGGSRISASGVATALWEIIPGDSLATTTITLRALDFGDPRPWSECWIEDHTVTGLVELETEEKEIIVSNLCQTYQLDMTQPSIIERLRPTPDFANGEPGGRCLVQFGAQWAILTEQPGLPAPKNNIFEGFYNVTLQYINKQRDLTSGTVFHGESCAVKHLGRMYGVKQDLAFSDPNAQQYIAWSDGTWVLPMLPTFPAPELRLQRLGSANGVLFVQGHETHSERAVVVVCDGAYVTLKNFGYRLRQICTSMAERDGYDSLIACGRSSSPGNISDMWSLIEFGGPADLAADEPKNGQEAFDILDDAGALYRFSQLPGKCHAIEFIDGDNRADDATHSALAQWDEAQRLAHGWDQGFTVWARVDSTADVYDLASYTIRVPYNRRLALPREGAAERVDVLFFVPADFGSTQAPGLYMKD